MRWLLIFVMAIAMGCVSVLTPPVGDSFGIFEQLEKELEAPEEICNSVTIKNDTPLDVDYVIVQHGPTYAPFFIERNVRYRGWIKSYSETTIGDCPIGHYWAVFKSDISIANLKYVVNPVKPTTIELTYNAKKIWANYGVLRP